MLKKAGKEQSVGINLDEQIEANIRQLDAVDAQIYALTEQRKQFITAIQVLQNLKDQSEQKTDEK